MIAHIKGTLFKKKPGELVVETGGLGLEIRVPLTTYIALPEPPAQVMLLTHVVIKEEAWDIYGFLSHNEKESFLALTSVTRVGPRLALTIISALEPAELAKALMTKDLDKIASIKGIGPKTAERLMLELKDKAPKLAALAGLEPTAFKDRKIASAPAWETDEGDEAVLALINLGYLKGEAEKATAKARQASPEADLGQLIRAALKLLTK